MKKLFSFRSSSSNGKNNEVPPSTDKQVYWESPWESELTNQGPDKGEHSFNSPRGLFSKSRKQVDDNQDSRTRSGLRRSRSLSSAAFLVDGLEKRSFLSLNDQSRSPCSSTSSARHQQYDQLSCHQALSPEKQSRTKQFEVAATKDPHQKTGVCGSFKTHHDLSGTSSSSSSNVSSKVVDRYIDGEEQQERSKQKKSSSRGNYFGNGNGGRKLPPRVQYTAPTSPLDGIKDKPNSHSFREVKGTHLHFSSKDCVENGFGHESPRRLAKNVIERLSRTHAFPRSGSKEFNRDIPITIEDVYGGSLNRSFDSNSDVPTQKCYSLDEPYQNVNGYPRDDFSGFQKENCLQVEDCGGYNYVEMEEDTDAELERRSREVEERVTLLSEELEQERFLCDCGFDVPSLVQAVRKLKEERVGLAYEISGLLQSRITERASAKGEIGLAKSELELRTRRLEKEKNELQAGLEKELDRRSSEWSFKLERCHLEEQRLRERVRELAEQNVSLQREVSSFHERETESRSMIAYSERQLKDLTTRVGEVSEENDDLRQSLSDLQEKYGGAVEDLDCIRRNFGDKEKECKELQKSVTRLLRTCSEQEKTIEGLQVGLVEEIGKKQPSEKFDQPVQKLQMEQMRLTGIELALRREVESYRVEVDSLRHENICLLNRLKGNGKEIGALTFKLDKEMWARIFYLQNQGLSMLNESTGLCSKLLDFIKGKAGLLQRTQQGGELIKNGLDEQFIVESDMKIQGFKRGAESLARSLQTISTLLREKSSPVALKSESPCMDADGSKKLNNQTLEETIRTELKAETLVTNLLREKLYSKELEVEQLQAELATAVRGNDILRCEIQSTLDNLSCVSHKLKDLELQMLKKDENMSQLQIDLQESSKELTIMRGILPKVSQERDLMWEEVKQYSEKNMLLNSEVNVLKKKIEALDEDILLKEGQITILKDTLGSRPFDLLSTDSTHEFLLH